jgi:hypothetical protein
MRHHHCGRSSSWTFSPPKFHCSVALRRDRLIYVSNTFSIWPTFLDFAGELLVLALGRQVTVVRDLSRSFFGFAFHFVKLAYYLIRRARFPRFSPFF